MSRPPRPAERHAIGLPGRFPPNRSRSRPFAQAAAVVIAFSCLCTATVEGWPGGHRTLRCDDCHGCVPDAGFTSAALLDSDRVELCLRCHEAMRHRQEDDSSLLVGHPAWGHAPAAVYEHYLGWVERNRARYDPPLGEEDLPMRRQGSGYWFDCSTCHPSERGSGGYSRIGMRDLELCVACHGGEEAPSPPGVPRLMYNPAHLGRTRDGEEYTASIEGPRDGSVVSGTLYFPLAVFTRVHANPRKRLGYVVEVDLGRDGVLDLQEYVSETTPGRPPMRWHTGNPPLGPRESQVHLLSTVGWQAGEHEVRLIPFDRVASRYGVAHRLRLRRSGETGVVVPFAVGLSCGGVLWNRLMRTWEDDSGNVLRLYCSDQGRNVDEFQLFFGTSDVRGRRIARCSGVGGVNSGYVVHAGDRDGNETPDAFLGMVWRSDRHVMAGPGAKTAEWKSYEYDAVANRLVLKRYHSDDGPGGESPDLLREEAADVDPMDFATAPREPSESEETSVLTPEAAWFGNP